MTVAQPIAQNDTNRAAERRQRKAFGEELTSHPPPAGTKRQPEADFPLSDGGPRKKKIRHVGARDQQDDRRPARAARAAAG